jgi:hypothetical protein
LNVTERGEHEQSRLGDPVGDMAKDEERRLVGPVDVVEDHDQAALVGRAPHRLGHVVQDPEPVLGRLDVTREHRGGVDAERAEHLAPRPERRRTLALEAAAPRHGDALGEREPGELLGEPGLADTGLANAQDQPTGAIAGRADPRTQRVELAPPSDHPVTHDMHRAPNRRGHTTKHRPSTPHREAGPGRAPAPVRRARRGAGRH